MIKTTDVLCNELKNYANVNNKVKRMVADGELFPLKRGLFETDKNIPGYCLAQIIYGPSYLSFEFALSYYGLIPEAVYLFTSATFKKRKKKEFTNCFGNFSYRDVPGKVYPYGITINEETGYPYAIATPEKAICDELYTLPPLKNQAELEILLYDDLRIYEDGLMDMNMDDLKFLSDRYGCTNVKLLYGFLLRAKKRITF